MIEIGLHGGEGVAVAEEASPISEKLLISFKQLWRTNSIIKPIIKRSIKTDLSELNYKLNNLLSYLSRLYLLLIMLFCRMMVQAFQERKLFIAVGTSV